MKPSKHQSPPPGWFEQGLVNEKGEVRFDVSHMLELLDLPDTKRNRDFILEMAQKIVDEQFPGSKVWMEEYRSSNAPGFAE
jgi:hypothetical protein